MTAFSATPPHDQTTLAGSRDNVSRTSWAPYERYGLSLARRRFANRWAPLLECVPTGQRPGRGINSDACKAHGSSRERAPRPAQNLVPLAPRSQQRQPQRESPARHPAVPLGCGARVPSKSRVRGSAAPGNAIPRRRACPEGAWVGSLGREPQVGVTTRKQKPRRGEGTGGITVAPSGLEILIPPLSWGFTPGYQPKPLRGEEKSDFDEALAAELFRLCFGELNGYPHAQSLSRSTPMAYRAGLIKESPPIAVRRSEVRSPGSLFVGFHPRPLLGQPHPPGPSLRSRMTRRKGGAGGSWVPARRVRISTAKPYRNNRASGTDHPGTRSSAERRSGGLKREMLWRLR
jgi:hypothetical protein